MTAKQHFIRELNRLKTDVKAFIQSQSHPDHPKHDLDDLLHGCAYLAAQIHQYIDHQAQTLPEQLARCLWPESLQHVPSHSVAVFKMTSMIEPVLKIPAKTILLSDPIGDQHVKCHFETIQDVNIYPFEISNIVLNAEKDTLTLDLSHHFARPYALSHLGQLSFFISAEQLQALDIYYYLRHFCTRVQLIAHEQSFSENLDMAFPLKSSCTSLLACQLILDYFSFPQQYWFFNVFSPRQIHESVSVKSFKVIFHFKKSFPRDFKISKNDICFNSILIVNKMLNDCEPFDHDHESDRYPVHVKHDHHDVSKILSIDAVQGYNKNTGKLTQYLPLSHVNDPIVPTFTVSHDRLLEDRCYIRFFNHPDHQEVISIRACASQGHYPRKYLTEKSLYLQKSRLSTVCTATNVMMPTQPLFPPETDVIQSFVKFLTLSLSSLTILDHLKRLLNTLNWSVDLQHQKRIEGIFEMQALPRSCIERGAFYHVTDIRMKVHSDHYLSKADIYAWGDVLFLFFKAHAVISQMISLHIQTYPDGEIFAWAPQMGQKQVL